MEIIEGKKKTDSRNENNNINKNDNKRLKNKKGT